MEDRVEPTVDARQLGCKCLTFDSAKLILIIFPNKRLLNLSDTVGQIEAAASRYRGSDGVKKLPPRAWGGAQGQGE